MSNELWLQKMKERKEALGYSYQDIAEMSGLPLSTVQKVFLGVSKLPRLKTRLSIEKALSTGYAYSHEEPVLVREESEPYQARHYTIKDLEAYYDSQKDALYEEPKELIDGVFYDMAPPIPFHQTLITYLSHLFWNYIEENNGPCVVSTSPGVQIDCDDDTLLLPDLTITCDTGKFGKKYIEGSPSLVIEVLSPSTRAKDMGLKLDKYKNAGVEEYWMVDPASKHVLVYRFSEDSYCWIYGFNDQIPVGIFNNDLLIDFAKIQDRIGFLL